MRNLWKLRKKPNLPQRKLRGCQCYKKKVRKEQIQELYVNLALNPGGKKWPLDIGVRNKWGNSTYTTELKQWKMCLIRLTFFSCSYSIHLLNNRKSVDITHLICSVGHKQTGNSCAHTVRSKQIKTKVTGLCHPWGIGQTCF